MKIKFNWGTGIVIAMAAFMVFILSFVYKTLAVEKYEHQLVSEDYYKDELHYQQEIDKLNNAAKLTQNIVLHNSNDGITIQFPQNMDYTEISGKILFQRLSNEKLDFNEEIKLDGSSLLIPKDKLVAGKWVVRIEWNHKGETYLYKESWFY
jgi:hypothetical protein